MEPLTFHYRPTCSAPGCSHEATYKVAASWTDGTSWELKNYGLACDEHKASTIARARLRREGLVLADGEAIGEVGLYELKADARDAQLVRLPDHGA